MDKNEIKHKLLLYRPGDTEWMDPEMVSALREAQRDPELSAWFQAHCAFQRAMVSALSDVKPPAQLRSQILGRSQPRSKVLKFPRGPRVILAMAASIALLIGLIFATFVFGRHEAQFKAFRERMAGTALRDYRMTMVSRDQNEIRSFLQKASPHGNYTLAPPLRRLPGEGCVLLTWEGHPVSWICLNGGDQKDIFVFVINKRDVSRPPSAKPEFRQENKLATYSWTQDDKVYMLATKGDRAALEKYVGI